MKILLFVFAGLLLTGCDATQSSDTTTPATIDSPFVVVTSVADQPAVDSAPMPTTENIADNTEIPTEPSDDNNTSPAESPNVETSYPTSSTDTTPAAANPAWQLYDSLLNARGSNAVDSFWACSTQQEDGTFRIQFTGRDRDSTYDVVNEAWGYTSALIQSDTNDYDAHAQGSSGINWRVETVDSIVFSSTRSEYSASNRRFFSMQFDQARNRFSAIDSQGVAIACARVNNTSVPLCSYRNPYGGCVLSPIGSGDDAIKVVRTFAPTLQLVNASAAFYLWNDFWQCASGDGLEPFRFYFTGNAGNSSPGSLKQASGGVGWRYDYEGSTFRDSALSWTADALGSVQFTVVTGSRTNRPLQRTSWTMFNIQPDNNGQNFIATDSRGYDFSCQRLEEPGTVRLPEEPEFRYCFHAPSVCPVRLP